ncbi:MULTISPECIES: hypothetical protein [unclassified Streptomyces]|uniref:hypothetical protein n=1 Tax=Streptomyces sp. NBRC 14336 TaxID=3030992 RepID=UPI002556222C|nr:hypothetical protein [Streptomyces sp. NBRC 14336]WBO82721.1 hypothetical protein SBE_006363 [Streptomyces sp. SBE_14.2]
MTRQSRWGTWGTGAAAMAACAACCAGPLLAVVGGLSITSAIASLWMPALAVSAVVAGAVALVLRRRRRASACRTAAPGRTDLGMPTIGPGPDAGQ